MNKRPEVIKYMRRIGMRVSLKYSAVMMVAIILIGLLTHDWHMLFVIVPFFTIVFVGTHFLVRWHVESTMYPFYCRTYDLRQKCLKALKQLEAKNEGK